MSTSWAVILVAATFLSAGTLLGTLIAPRSVEAAKEAEPPAPPRIGYVNTAKVLREFKKAIETGKTLIAKRQEYFEKMKPVQEAIDAKTKELGSAVNANERETLQKELAVLRQEIGKVNQEAQKTLGEMTDQMIGDVYKDIQGVIADLASERKLDVVECFSDATTPEDMKKTTFAQQKLQSTALYPFYVRKELLVTDDVIEMLNKKHPPAKAEKK